MTSTGLFTASPDCQTVFGSASEQPRESDPRSLSKTIADQGMFDAWHQDACTELGVLYARSGFSAFCVGQAQKWMNMAFKYTHVFGEERLPGFQRLYHFGHVPLDRIMMAQLQPYGSPRLSRSWSRIRDYAEYMNVQEWIRKHFPSSAPLAVEFRLWLAAAP